MYVLMDLEWVETKERLPHPSQLSAVRVDEFWNATGRWNSLICPPDEGYHVWDHCAYAGPSMKKRRALFLAAPSAEEAFASFRSWLREDDVLCWWYPNYGELMDRYAAELSERHIVLYGYVAELLQGREYLLGHPHAMCDRLGITKITPRHNACNDTETMRRVLSFLGLSQERLKEKSIFPAERPTSLLLDPTDKKIHKKGCPALAEEKQYSPCGDILKAIKKSWKPCGCCGDIARRLLIGKNTRTARNCRFQFVWAEGSTVFHRLGCRHGMAAKAFGGAYHYKTCVKRGLRPCKVCKPEPPAPAPAPQPPKSEAPKKEKIFTRNLNLPEERAWHRYRQAREERDAYLSRHGKETPFPRDHIVLTHPGYAFWCAAGYQTFHVRECRKLNDLQDLRGFPDYNSAKSLGYTPCKLCKPSPKRDLSLSIPLFSVLRNGEPEETLEILCLRYHMEYKRQGTVHTMRTKVGIWRTDSRDIPYRLEHINLIRGDGNKEAFHSQPRMFLSMADIIKYIVRHDNNLMRDAGIAGIEALPEEERMLPEDE